MKEQETPNCQEREDMLKHDVNSYIREVREFAGMITIDAGLLSKTKSPQAERQGYARMIEIAAKKLHEAAVILKELV